MKSHVVLLGKVLEDSGTWCCTSTTLDLKTIKSRVKHEGFSFLTITLPTFAKDFERGLELGKVDSTLFLSFKKRGCLPAFLQGFTSQVFDRGTGVLLDDYSIFAIQAVRQICYLFHKLELPCSDTREQQAMLDFIKCDKQVSEWNHSDHSLIREDFRRVSTRLFRDVFYRIEQDVLCGRIVPKHGPGATADRTKANAKYDYRIWTNRLEELFPAGEFLYPSWSHFLEAESDGLGPTWLEPGAEIPVRVISVPKTLKTPRIIAIEPTHMQYVQQGLHEKFVSYLEGSDSLSSYIGFTDQEPNRILACQGSVALDLATLDLSEASDRVSNQHVSDLFSRHPILADAVFACRSPKADVPGHGIHSLAKFASMGSALTFPLEAMVFLTIIFIGIERELNTQLTPKLINELKGQVRVYGDDIIIPVRFVHSVIDALEDFGLRVNRHKSFWIGKFRESCGGDYYDGIDVNTVKVRHNLPTSRRHVTEIRATVALRNQLYFAGYWTTAAYLDGLLRRLIPFPTVHPFSPGYGRHTLLDYEVQRECKHLQRPLVKAYVDADQIPKSNLENSGALLKYFLKRGDEPLDKKHLERAGRPESSNIKLRWIPPY
jgi:hypothetical protein